MDSSKKIDYDYLNKMEDLIEASILEGETWQQRTNNLAFITMAKTEMPRLIQQLRLYMKTNEELQFLDSMQQMAIERLNKEVNLLRESLHLLEQQHKLMLVQNASI